MTPIDPTVVIERMARRFRAEGAPHPVAAATAVAARGHARQGQADFATTAGLTAECVGSCEAGDIAFGELPPTIGLVISSTGADLLALADLESSWRDEPPIRTAER